MTFILFGIVLLVYAGVAMSEMPEIMGEMLEGMLAESGNIFGMMLDLPNMLEMRLGEGYWVTLVALVVVFVILIIAKILDHPKKKPDIVS